VQERICHEWLKAALEQLPELQAHVKAAIPLPVLMAPDHSARLQTAMQLQPHHVDQIRRRFGSSRTMLPSLKPSSS
jgi:hypothetical protein